jgi:hypothetical protein
MTDRNRRVAPARGRAGKGRAPARERPARAVFVSYRRSDAAGEAGRLADHLASALGEPSVFLDVAAIAAGDDWRSRLDTALDACDTMLVVIGRQWLTLPSSEHPSRRRIDDSTDMVAWEVARALTRGLRVVQVLVQGVSPLVPETLPSAIAALAMRQAVELRHESFAADVQALVAQVRKSRRVRSLFAGDWRAADLSRWERPLDCGPDATCAAFTIVNALELLLVRAGAPQALSARYLYEKAKRSEQRRVDVEGIYMLPALFVASFFGVPPESVWPYQTGKADLPQGITWQTLEESIGWSCRGEFFRVDGLADAVRHIGAGRPVIAVCHVFEDVVYKPGRGGEISMPSTTAVSSGTTSALLTGFDPSGPRFRWLFPWGTGYGDRGSVRMSLDVARRLIDPEQLWSVQLAPETAEALLAHRAGDVGASSRRSTPAPRT